jgi:hypothetical protein
LFVVEGNNRDAKNSTVQTAQLKYERGFGWLWTKEYCDVPISSLSSLQPAGGFHGSALSLRAHQNSKASVQGKHHKRPSIFSLSHNHPSIVLSSYHINNKTNNNGEDD